MKVRQIVIILVAVAILVVGKLTSDFLGKPKEKEVKDIKAKVTSVYTSKVNNTDIPIIVESTGKLEAVNRMELYSEVQGVMLPDNGRFKSGTSFKRGAVLVSVRAEEQVTSLVAKRSGFERLISSVLPDVKIDYSEEASKWQTFLRAIDVNKSIPSLPEVKDEKLKLFLTGRDVYSNYYNLKNAEILLAKYQIRAPYDGVLISTNVSPGTVIRPGQPLGVFMKPGEYELAASVDASTVLKLKKGQEVSLSLKDGSDKSWTGNIIRVNQSLNPQNQMNEFYVRVKSNELSEGMYVRAKVYASSIENAMEISRSVLNGGKHVYVVEDSLLVQKEVVPVHFKSNTVIVTGLKNGEHVLTKIPPGSFEGMVVKIIKEN